VGKKTRQATFEVDNSLVGFVFMYKHLKNNNNKMMMKKKVKKKREKLGQKNLACLVTIGIKNSSMGFIFLQQLLKKK
jgi:hypothetical protein